MHARVAPAARDHGIRSINHWIVRWDREPSIARWMPSAVDRPVGGRRAIDRPVGGSRASDRPVDAVEPAIVRWVAVEPATDGRAVQAGIRGGGWIAVVPERRAHSQRRGWAT